MTTNKPVMALGGFSGSDPILTTSQLKTLIHQGTVRYFLLNSFKPGQQLPPQFLKYIPEQFREQLSEEGGFGFGQSSLTSWVTQHCTTVLVGQKQSSSTVTNQRSSPFGAADQLYDCAMTH